MKCEFCTGNMTIEDAVCPHCGRPNPFYEAHRQDMAQYERQFQRTKNEAIETNVRHTRKAVQVAIITVLVALILGSFIVLILMDDIYDAMDKRKNRKNADTIVETLTKYEEAKDFYNFAAYFNMHQNGINSDIRQFYTVDSAISYARSIESSIMGLVFNEYYLDASQMAASMSKSYDCLLEIKENAAKNPQNAAYAPEHMESCEYIMNDVHTLLKTYCGFTDEEVAALGTMTTAERQLAFEKKIERVMANEE